MNQAATFQETLQEIKISRKHEVVRAKNLTKATWV
jgi:hypothetical protein